jgi:hypothetical protein
MHTNELRREFVAMADELESFTGEVGTLHRKRRRQHVITVAIAAVAIAGVATGGAVIAASQHDHVVRVSSAPSKEVAPSKVTRIDAIVVPASEAVKLALDQSKLVAEYASVPHVRRPDSLLETNAWRSAMCALRSADGYAVTATTPGTNLAADLQRALGTDAKVYTTADRFGAADAEIFMNVGATPAETHALSTRLEHDPDVRSFRYISTDDAYTIFKAEFAGQQSLIQSTKPGDLPQSFRVIVNSGASVANVAGRYDGVPGVDTVITQNAEDLWLPMPRASTPAPDSVPDPCTKP